MFSLLEITRRMQEFVSLVGGIAEDGVVMMRLHGALVFVSLSTVLFIYRLLKSELVKQLWEEYKLWPWTKLVGMFSVVYGDELRQNLRKVKWPIMRRFSTAHSHPDAAAERSAADRVLTDLIYESGMKPYSISPSNADDRAFTPGMRIYHSIKSIVQRGKIDDISKTSVFKMTDVDYYVNMPALLRHRRAIVMYTFCPTRPAGSTPDSVYTINKRDEVEFAVIGGAKYQHKLWDYNYDQVVSHHWYGSNIFAVESVVTPNDDQRRIVMLTPQRTIYLPGLSWWMLSPQTLKRRSFNVGDFTCIKSVVNDPKTTVLVSVSKPGSYHSVSVPEDIGYMLCSKVQNSKHAPIASVISGLKTAVDSKHHPIWSQQCRPEVNAMLLAEVMAKQPLLFGPVTNDLVTVPEFSPHYTVRTSSSYLEEAIPSMREISPSFRPICLGATVPTRCVANDQACIDGRVVAQKNFAYPSNYKRYVHEFVTLISSGREQSLIPTEFDEVYDRQDRPSQRAILERCACMVGDVYKMVVSSFQKAESYAKVAAPRNISTVPGNFKMQHSRYMYSLSDALKDEHWYFVGMTPRSIAQAIAEKAMKQTWCVCTDYSKFDGRRSQFLVDAEVELCKSLFAIEHHHIIEKLIRSQVGCMGFTTHGVAYNVGTSRLSGSPETSVLNTFDNALMAYCALREADYFDTPEQIYQRLGGFLGDDAFNFGLDAEIFERVASDFGEKLKADVSRIGDPITFLSRVFHPWNGGLGSYTTVKRQLTKLHLTHAAIEVPTAVVLFRSASGYLLTDPDTPILSNWARAVVRIYGGCAVAGPDNQWAHEVRRDSRWFEQYDRDEQFPPPEDPDNTVDEVARDLGCDVVDVHNAMIQMDRAVNADELFAETLFGTLPTVELDALIADRLELTGDSSVSDCPPRRRRSHRGRPSSGH